MLKVRFLHSKSGIIFIRSVRQELAKEKELRSAIETEYATIKDRETFLNNELEAYKKTRANLLKRHEIASRERSQSINVISHFIFDKI